MLGPAEGRRTAAQSHPRRRVGNGRPHPQARPSCRPDRSAWRGRCRRGRRRRSRGGRGWRRVRRRGSARCRRGRAASGAAARGGRAIGVEPEQACNPLVAAASRSAGNLLGKNLATGPESRALDHELSLLPPPARRPNEGGFDADPESAPVPDHAALAGAAGLDTPVRLIRLMTRDSRLIDSAIGRIGSGRRAAPNRHWPTLQKISVCAGSSRARSGHFDHVPPGRKLFEGHPDPRLTEASAGAALPIS
jgi:hypothetical protein